MSKPPVLRQAQDGPVSTYGTDHYFVRGVRPRAPRVSYRFLCGVGW
ncbi:MAG: hypothetical protein J7J98_02310 [candidate division Zixibacteria bacterium]|nr:hypothetical protein [candidate division Zixibacteria bacterium]